MIRPDDELVEAYATARDERAFAELVTRHGGAVQRACQRVTGDEADAEDAAQAVFLVLARRARSLPKQSHLAGWLQGVAWRVASAQVRAKRRRLRREARWTPEAEGATTPADAAQRTEILKVL